eukprot:scaffold52829_cov57-Phaeocystis_antarctica.AAC.1
MRERRPQSYARRTARGPSGSWPLQRARRSQLTLTAMTKERARRQCRLWRHKLEVVCSCVLGTVVSGDHSVCTHQCVHSPVQTSSSVVHFTTYFIYLTNPVFMCHMCHGCGVREDTCKVRVVNSNCCTFTLNNTPHAVDAMAPHPQSSAQCCSKRNWCPRDVRRRAPQPLLPRVPRRGVVLTTVIKRAGPAAKAKAEAAEIAPLTYDNRRERVSTRRAVRPRARCLRRTLMGVHSTSEWASVPRSSSAPAAHRYHCTSASFGCACMAATTTVRPPASIARCLWARGEVPPQSSISAMQPISCTAATCGCTRIAATTASIAPASAALSARASPVSDRKPKPAVQRWTQQRGQGGL